MFALLIHDKLYLNILQTHFSILYYQIPHVTRYPKMHRTHTLTYFPHFVCRFHLQISSKLNYNHYANTQASESECAEKANCMRETLPHKKAISESVQTEK